MAQPAQPDAEEIAALQALVAAKAQELKRLESEARALESLHARLLSATQGGDAPPPGEAPEEGAGAGNGAEEALDYDEEVLELMEQMRAAQARTLAMEREAARLTSVRDELQAEVDRLKQGGSHPHTLVLPRINVDLEAELEIKTQLLAEVEENYKRSFAEVEEAYKKAYAEAEETHKQTLAEAQQKADADRTQYSTTLADLETRLAAANAWEQRLLARTAEPDALRAQLQHANDALQRESARVLQLEQQLKDVQQSDAAKSKKRKSRPGSD